MGDPDEILASTRLRLRREDPRWHARGSDSESPPSGTGGPEVARAARLQDTSIVAGGNRFAAPKRLLLRAIRFHTDREVQFNRAVVDALVANERGIASLLRSVDNLGQRLRSLDARVADLEDAAARAERERSATSSDLRSMRRTLEEVRETLRGLGPGVLGSEERGLHGGRVGQVYPAFEERFRGSDASVRERIAVYGPKVAARLPEALASLPFLDVGCGRGELVDALRAQGLLAEGVEANKAFAESCRERGLPVVHADLFEALRSRAPGSLGGIAAIQVVEHFRIEALLEFLDLAFSRLAAGGLVLLETIDTSTLAALRWYFADPTHALPLMPDTLRFWVENAGFRDVEVLHLHPAAPPVETEPASVRSLLQTVYGPQDFGLLATRPGTARP